MASSHTTFSAISATNFSPHSFSSTTMSSSFLFLFLLLPLCSATATTTTVCGNLQIPFPFSLNTTTPPSLPILPNPFLLYCLNSTSLFLNLTDQSYRILQFLSDAVLVDFPGPSPCRNYNDFNAFSPVSRNPFFAISDDNLLALYDCNDSSLCKPICKNLVLPGCDDHDSPACCYPLTDRTLWRNRGDFTLFLKMGCRGFSSWVVEKGWRSGKRGVKLEWGLPRNLTICDRNGFVVNATAVNDGVRCSCSDGFVGDGFANGFGCLKCN